jgi:hypothetical protein
LLRDKLSRRKQETNASGSQEAAESTSTTLFSNTNSTRTSIQDAPETSARKSPLLGNTESAASTAPVVNPDLWKRAYEELGTDKENKSWIERYERIVNSIAENDESKAKGLSLQEQMASIVEGRMKIMTNRQWVLQWGSRSFKIREQVEKIVKVVQKVSGIGSSIASLDPTHAGIAWVGICVILPVSNTLT